MSLDPLLQRLLAEDSFEHETFRDLDLDKAQLGGKELYRCTFENCRLQESRWKDCRLEDCVVKGSDLTRATFRGCTLTATDFSAATGLFLEPARNRLKDTRVAVEAAVLLAEAQGMRVAGYSAEPKKAGRRGRS